MKKQLFIIIRLVLLILLLLVLKGCKGVNSSEDSLNFNLHDLDEDLVVVDEENYLDLELEYDQGYLILLETDAKSELYESWLLENVSNITIDGGVNQAFTLLYFMDTKPCFDDYIISNLDDELLDELKVSLRDKVSSDESREGFSHGVHYLNKNISEAIISYDNLLFMTEDISGLKMDYLLHSKLKIESDKVDKVSINHKSVSTSTINVHASPSASGKDEYIISNYNMSQDQSFEKVLKLKGSYLEKLYNRKENEWSLDVSGLQSPNYWFECLSNFETPIGKNEVVLMNEINIDGIKVQCEYIFNKVH